MKLLIVTQKVDKNDPILGFFVCWVREFAARCEGIIVVCLEKGEYDLPDNVRVLSLGKEEGKSTLEYLSRFYRYIWRQRKNYDGVLVHMTPIYAILGGLLWRIWSKRIGLWYTHKSVDLKLRIASLLVHNIFTASRESFTLENKKVRVLGHGIDVDRFAAKKEKSGDAHGIHLLHVGRITPIKNIGTLIEVAHFLKQKGHEDVCVELVGTPTSERDREYAEEIIAAIAKYNLEDNIIFSGDVPNSEIPGYLQKADATINLAPTGGMDKAVLESMASGTPVFVSNETFKEYLGPYAADFLFKERDARDAAEKISRFFAQGDTKEVRTFLIQKAREEASVTALVGTLVDTLKQPLPHRLRFLAKDALFSVLRAMHPSLGEKASILMYHSIGEDGTFFAVQTEVFEQQMAHLAQKKYRVIPLSKLIEKIKKKESIAGCIALTFDDGYRNTYDTAAPILKKHDFPATVFVATGLLGRAQGSSMMSGKEAQELCRGSLWECMPHSVSHPDLDAIALKEAQKEISDSQRAIAEISGKDARIFSYPRGKYTGEIIEYLRKGDWDGAVTVREGLVGSDSNPFLLPRNSVDSGTSFTQFKGKVSGAVGLYTALKSFLK